jgi:hypothetical protein
MECNFVKLCISTYPRELDALDAKVDAAKRAGWTKASRSSLIRAAVEAYDVTRYAGERKAGA